MLSPKAWYRGAGKYDLHIEFVRSDGGQGSQLAQLLLEGNESRIEGRLMFFDGPRLFSRPSPKLEIEVAQRPPPGLRLELESSVSAQGQARYRLVNSTPLTFRHYSGLHLDKQEGASWVSMSRDFENQCYEVGRDSWLDAGDNESLDAARSLCLASALKPGHYRHWLWLILERPPRDSHLPPVEVQRFVELEHEFDIPSGGGVEAASALPSVSAADLRVDWARTLGWRRPFIGARSPGEIAVTVVAPRGEQACVCPGLLVGRERLEVRAGADGPCLLEDAQEGPLRCRPIPPASSEMGQWHLRLRASRDAGE